MSTKVWLMGWDVLSYLSYWSSILPLLACAVLYLVKRPASSDAWLLSAAFFVSFIADSLAAALAQQGINNWWLSYAFAPLQFGLLLYVVSARTDVRNVALIGLLLLAIASVTRGTLDAPETFVKVIGGALVGLLVLHGPVRRFRGPVLLYCMGAIPWLLAMGAVPREQPAWFWLWVAYLITRITALGWMVRALTRPTLTVEEVRHGSGQREVFGERRARVRRAGGGARHGLATKQR
jgi:hypothetical protein